MRIPNGLCLCNGGTNTGITTNKKAEFNFKIVKKQFQFVT